MSAVSLIQSYFKSGISEFEAWKRISEAKGKGFVSPNVVKKYFQKFREDRIQLGNKTNKKGATKRRINYSSEDSDEEYVPPQKKRGRKPRNQEITRNSAQPQMIGKPMMPRYVKINPPQKIQNVVPQRVFQPNFINGTLPRFVSQQPRQNVQQTHSNSSVPPLYGQYVYICSPDPALNGKRVFMAHPIPLANQAGFPQMAPYQNTQYGHPIPFSQVTPQFNGQQNLQNSSDSLMTNQVPNSDLSAELSTSALPGPSISRENSLLL